MGPHLMNRPPKFVHGFIDRHGKPRFYFRRAGFKRVALPGLPWSPEFMAAYEKALAGQRGQVGANRVKDGTIRALAASYFASPAFLSSLRPNSQRVYRSAIDVFCRTVDRDGAAYGDKMTAGLRRDHVVKIIGAKSETPQSANFLLKVLRTLMRHAVEIGLRSDDPTQGVRPIKFKSDGHHAWSEGEIAQFEQAHPLGSRERLAFALLLHTGQRRSDVIRMGHQHIQDGILRVRQEKTGVELLIPVNAELAAAITTLPGGNLTFLVTRFGRPFTPVGFTNWFSTACDLAGLSPHCTAHGLRKSCARRLAEAGCTAHEIAAITGHASLAEVQRYTRSPDQKRLAIAAMAKVKARTETGKPERKV